MDFECALSALEKEIAEKIAAVYHKAPEVAFVLLRNSEFYQALSNSTNDLLKDGAEINFLRYQNEIEYGAWNKNEYGGIAE